MAKPLKLVRKKMKPTRRAILKGAGALPLPSGGFGLPVQAIPSGIVARAWPASENRIAVAEPTN
jgi:hypothetical protein